MPSTKLTWPLFWLAVQGVLLLVLCLTLDVFLIYPVDLDGYWATLKQMERADLAGVLSDARTVGYPLLLKTVLLFSRALEALPLVQLAIRVLAVLAFYAGLVVVGARPWLALAMASALLYTNAIFSYDVSPRVTQVMTESVSESLFIFTIGCFFWALARPGRVLPWCGFALGLFLTYQTRAAYQYVVVLLPAVGLVLAGMTTSPPEAKRRQLAVGLGLLVAALGPFLLWCLLRLAVVGHFGLVAYAGSNLSGVAGQFLTEDVIPELPDEIQAFAKAALVRRNQILSGEMPGPVKDYRPFVDDEGKLSTGITEDGYLFMFHQLHVFHNVATDFYGDDPILRDRKQMELAWALIRARPGPYLRWVVTALRAAPANLLKWNVVLAALVVLLGLAVLAWHVAYLVRRTRGGPAAIEKVDSASPSYAWELNLILPVALGVAACQMTLVAMTTATVPRYCDTAGIFLPCLAVVALAMVFRRIHGLLRRRPVGVFPRPPKGST